MIQGPPSPLAWAVLERPNEIVPMNDRRDEFMEGRRRPS
jgi:hypothetical protein